MSENTKNKNGNEEKTHTFLRGIEVSVPAADFLNETSDVYDLSRGEIIEMSLSLLEKAGTKNLREMQVQRLEEKLAKLKQSLK